MQKLIKYIITMILMLFYSLSFADGTGFLVSNNGYIITNKHVVGRIGPNTHFFVLYNSQLYEARYISSTPGIDLAELQILHKTSCLRVGSSNISVGDMIFPLIFNFLDGQYDNFEQKKELTGTAVTSIDSNILGQLNTFTFSPYIRPGNSGSPVLDRQSNVIGVVFAELSILGHHYASYGIGNRYLLQFISTRPEINCQNPDIGFSTKQDLVWIEKTDI